MVSPLVTGEKNLFTYSKMPAEKINHLSISFDDDTKGEGRLTKYDQLALARKKAVESRRRRQLSKLEEKIEQVRLLLGEASISKGRSHSGRGEKTELLLLEIIEILTDNMSKESLKRTEEYKSLRRHIDHSRPDDNKSVSSTVSSLPSIPERNSINSNEQHRGKNNVVELSQIKSAKK